MKLTIGMAVYDDGDAAICTLHALALYHQDVLPQCEILVIDNHPGSPHSKRIQHTCGWLGMRTSEAWNAAAMAGKTPDWEAVVGKMTYLPFTDVVGTSEPRQQIFLRASAPAVLCIDAHVMLPPGVLARLIKWYDEHPNTMDLFQGPLEMDDHRQYSTHFDDVWRDNMWGTWSTDPRGLNPENPPFEIPAQGLGLFTCRKDAWIRFPEGLRGFGGEEHMMHEMWRRAGRKVYCLPWLRWWHLFRDPAVPPPFPLVITDRIRNYIIWGKHLGLDLTRLREHFVGRNVIPQEAWDALVANPHQPPAPPQFAPAPAASGSGCSSCGAAAAAAAGNPPSLDSLYESMCRAQSDLHTHLPKLKELASKCGTVTEITQRHQSTVALLAGQPSRLISYTSALGSSHILPMLDKIKGNTTLVLLNKDALDPEVSAEPTDLLFIDEIQLSDRIWAQLQKFGHTCARFIIFHDTQIYGERGPNGQAGILPALRRWVKERPEWSVIYHTQEQYGLTVLGRLPEDKPKLPSLTKMAWNYAKAIARHVATGMEHADEATVQARLSTCDLCDQRVDNRCAVCGCYLDQGPDGREGKAIWKESVCPLGKW